ncbi:MAG: hypothetical protein V1644_02750 [Candidatus Micrarchaeota archaeon]
MESIHMKRIIVTGAGGSAGINFIDSIRSAPEKIFIVGTDINKWHLELPDLDIKQVIPPASNIIEYLTTLNKIIEEEKIEFVHPQPDVEVKVLSQNRDKLKAKTFLPSKDTIAICQDKVTLNKILKKQNIPVPLSFIISNRDDLQNAINNLKGINGKIWLRAKCGMGTRAALPIKELRHGEMWIDYWKTTANIGYGDFMACEFLPGKEFAFQSVWKNGELITSMARERLEYIFGHLTPSGQYSSPSVAQTVHRADVNETATKAILAVDKNASGIFCVDLKENQAGIPCVTEINAGRFFTTSNFFTKLGVNMPFIYLKLAYGEELPTLKKYNAAPEGYYWIRLMDKGPKLLKV